MIDTGFLDTEVEDVETLNVIVPFTLRGLVGQDRLKGTGFEVNGFGDKQIVEFALLHWLLLFDRDHQRLHEVVSDHIELANPNSFFSRMTVDVLIEMCLKIYEKLEPCVREFPALHPSKTVEYVVVTEHDEESLVIEIGYC